MDLTQRHLGPIFENIRNLLAGVPGELDRFAPWAEMQAARLRNAAQHGVASLSYEAEMLRDELAMLTPVSTSPVTARTERMRLCQRQWLTGLLDFVDDLVESQQTELHLMAA